LRCQVEADFSAKNLGNSRESMPKVFWSFVNVLSLAMSR